MTSSTVSTLALFAVLLPAAAAAQSIPSPAAPIADAALIAAQQPTNVPPQAQRVEDEVQEAVRRFRVGVIFGAGFDPELIMFGGHAAFGPLFHRGVEFRPGIEVGIGELTTFVGINADVLYLFPGATGQTRWRPYIGAGPTFGLSHRSFETEDVEHVDSSDDRNRFDFSDTDFNNGVNFIAGARNRNGLFFELKATAGGVSNVRILAGYNF
jgi:hypothetical protein